LRAWLQERQVAHVVATRCDEKVSTAHGVLRIDALIAGLPRQV
jgi:hypothetical protein